MLTKRMQQEAVAAALEGGETGLRVEDFWDADLKQAYWELWELAAMGGEREDRIQAAVRILGREELGEILTLIEEPVRWPSLQEISTGLPQIDWLWPGWIPLGMITLLGAVPGAGKSYLALDLARRMIAGEPFPDGSPQPRVDPVVLYVDAEVVPQLINERATKWGMDRSRLYLLLPGDERLYIDFGTVEDRDTLVEMAYHLKPGLIVVDSLSSISSRGENNVEDVRAVLGFLNILAQDNQCGLVLIHHLRKRGSNRDAGDMVGIDDFRGSGHIIAMARSVMGLSIVQTGPELDKNGPRRLEVVKTNLGAYPKPIGVEFVSRGTGAWLEYGQAPVVWESPTKSDECGEWLVKALEKAGEPLTPGEMVEMGEEQGFSRKTIYRARKALEGTVVNTKGRKNPQNRWGLKERDDHGEEDNL